MKKELNGEMEDELRSEYDLRELLKEGVRGKYAQQYRTGTNLVLLDPDVAEAFPTEAAVNQALRLVVINACEAGQEAAASGGPWQPACLPVRLLMPPAPACSTATPNSFGFSSSL